MLNAEFIITRRLTSFYIFNDVSDTYKHTQYYNYL